MFDVNKAEKELGISMEIFFKALKKGIWSKEHCNSQNKHYRQESPFTVTPCFEEGKWVFYFNEHAYGDTGCRSAYIFEDDVNVADYGKTWFLTKSEEMVTRDEENG